MLYEEAMNEINKEKKEKEITVKMFDIL